jgi:hypothetical protein
MQILDIPFEVAKELAREFLSSELFLEWYTFERIDFDNPSRTGYSLTKILNREYGVKPHEIGTVVLVKLDERRTGISADPLPLQEELQKIERAWSLKNRPVILDTAPNKTALEITATPEEVEATQRAEEAIVEKYHIENEAHVAELMDVLELLRGHLERLGSDTEPPFNSDGPHLYPVRLPTLYLPTRQEFFEKGLSHYVFGSFPALDLETHDDAPARRYKVRTKAEGSVIAEIDTVPVRDDKDLAILAVRVALLRIDDSRFGTHFWNWVYREHGIPLPPKLLAFSNDAELLTAVQWAKSRLIDGWRRDGLITEEEAQKLAGPGLPPVEDTETQISSPNFGEVDDESQRTEDAERDTILSNEADPAGGKYGTCRDLTIDEVRAIVARCRAFQEKGGNVPEFHRRQKIVPGAPRSYELETLRGWLKDPKFRHKAT